VITAQEGDSLALTCLHASTSPKTGDAVPAWKVAGSKPADSSLELHELPSDGGFNVTVSTRTIRFDPLERSDAPLRLDCAAVAGSDARVTVDVAFPPTFTIRRVPAFGIPVVEGMKISMVRNIFLFCQKFLATIITFVNSGDETWQMRHFILCQ
jgi:hypothetical protein